jgi:hypothetical protein
MALTVAALAATYTRRMEWMLQAVDEVDDAVSTLRLYAMGFSRLSVVGSVAACALFAALLRAAS